LTLSTFVGFILQDVTGDSDDEAGCYL